jgi:xanthine dehydrogenase accessory factor
MLDLLPELRRLHEEGTPFALATLVETRGSAPRDPGAVLALAADGTVWGSVSGGCVEGALCAEAEDVLAGGAARVAEYGVSDESAFAAGLTCGGTLRVLVRAYRDPEERAALLTALAPAESGTPLALATVVASVPQGPAVGAWWVAGESGTEGEAAGGGPSRTGSRGAGRREDAGPRGTARRGGAAPHGAEFARAVRREAAARLARGGNALLRLGAGGARRESEVTVFVQTWTTAPRMLVFGAIDHAAATARIGSFLGYRVTVCDARPAFATRARFPHADEVVCRWPSDYLAETPTDARTAICVLTHDPKFDVPLVLAALRTPAAYLGVMGSRRTHHERTARLRAAGATPAELARLSSPIGLDLGGRTPEETAVSIAAELIRVREGGTGRRLRELV